MANEWLPRHWIDVTTAYRRCDRWELTYFYQGLDHRWYTKADGVFSTPLEAMQKLDELYPLTCGCAPGEVLAYEIQEAKEGS